MILSPTTELHNYVAYNYDYDAHVNQAPRMILSKMNIQTVL